METATQQAPAGFRNIPGEEATGIRIDKTALIHGVILQFRGTRRFARKDGDGQTVVHTFLARAGEGDRFSLFGTAQLDGKLKDIRSGSYIWLSYGGKKTLDGQETHTWNVSDGGRLSAESLARLRKNSTAEEAELDAKIAAARDENTERRNKEPNFDPGDFDFPER